MPLHERDDRSPSRALALRAAGRGSPTAHAGAESIEPGLSRQTGLETPYHGRAPAARPGFLADGALGGRHGFSMMTLLALTVPLPVGVNAPLAVSFIRLARVSSPRPLPVSKTFIRVVPVL
jgi:hypothetical protein